MQNRLLSFSFFAIVCWLQATISLGQSPLSLKILSYNVHHCRGLDDKIDIERIAKIVQSVKPDLVALQEIDNKTRRCGMVDQAAELGRLTKMEAKFFKAIDFEGGEYGQAILSRVPIREARIHLLPNLPGREQRIAGITELEFPAGKLCFCTLHLDHAHDKLRLQQAEELVSILSKSELPTIIAGDFNARPDSDVMKHFHSAFALVKWEQPLLTFPAQSPSHQIDYVAARPKSVFETQSIKVLAESVASDHRPIFAELSWQSN